MEIAPLQREELDLADSLLKDLTEVYGLEHRKSIRRIQEKLDSWAARVAVIGQVKAGKSTFLNAFLHMDDFLPSDVNPWTSVVTNIRINLKNDPRSGVSFEFFNESDWNEIKNGDAEVRKLTEELLPGFDSSTLHEQVDYMQELARKRMGEDYQSLLGQTHEYDYLNSDLMRQYVCAGSDDVSATGEDGRFTTITKVAQAYMRRPEFKVPVILTDTPGVNDPFLVRDEFTCRSLDSSDVFIVVLSAHQALTEVDVSLIRLLGQQDSKDVIIFINRIDELDAFATEVPQIIEDVKTRLAEVVPDLSFTIRAGSAFMADIASTPGEEAEEIRNELDNDELKAYLQSTFGFVPETQVDRLYAAAGIDQIKRVMSDTIDNGVGSRKLDQVYQEIRAEVGGMLFSIKRERESTQKQLQDVGDQNLDQAIADLENELKLFQDVQAKLSEVVENGGASISKMIENSWERMQSELNNSVVSFAESKNDLLSGLFSRNNATANAKSEVKINLSDLQLDFEKVVVSNFQRFRDASDTSLNNCLISCQNMMKQSFSHLVENVTLEDLPHDSFTSTLTLAKKEVVLPVVKERSWAFWRKSKVNQKQTMKALKEIVSTELKPVVEKLTSAVNEALIERSEEGMERIRVLTRSVEMTMNESGRRIRRDRRYLERAETDAEVSTQLVSRLQTQIDLQDSRIRSLSVIESSLKKAVFLDAA